MQLHKPVEQFRPELIIVTRKGKKIPGISVNGELKGVFDLGWMDEHNAMLKVRFSAAKLSKDAKLIAAKAEHHKNKIVFGLPNEPITKVYKTKTVRVYGIAKNAVLFSEEIHYQDESED